ncbi:MAG: AhpC/TSA family protein [Prevotella sp.]|nr:AhpC/TSA family protein [Prevotella sp.]MBR5062525.1 AhpC/TSA family protein [Prevotella sp.]
MKKMTVIACAMVAMNMQAQNATQGYTVSGTCPSEKVFIVDVANRNAPIDSVDVKDGKFVAKGMAAKDAFLGLQRKGGQNYTLFINDGTPVTADLAKGIVKGSPLNEKLNVYDRHIDSLNDVAQGIIEPYMKAQREGKSQEELQAMVSVIQAKIAPIEEELTNYSKQIIADNPQNVIPAAFFGNVMYDYELPELKALLDESHPYANHPMMERIKKFVAQEEAKLAIVGQQFIDIEENDPEGNPHKLSEYVGKGNYVLIDFWASWCGPCMAEMPNVKANYDKYHDKGFNVVGLSFDRNKDNWVKAIKDKKLNWVHLSDLQYWNTIAAKTYNINSIPSSLLVDPTGKVIARDLRGDKLGAKLAEIYGM